MVVLLDLILEQERSPLVEDVSASLVDALEDGRLQQACLVLDKQEIHRTAASGGQRSGAAPVEHGAPMPNRVRAIG